MTQNQRPTWRVGYPALLMEELEGVLPADVVGIADPTAWMNSYAVDHGDAGSLGLSFPELDQIRDSLGLEERVVSDPTVALRFFVPMARDVGDIARRLITTEIMPDQRMRYAAALTDDIADPEKVVVAVSAGDDVGVLVYDRTLLVKQDEAVILNRLYELSASTADLVPCLETAFVAQQKLDIETAVVSLIDARRFPQLDLVVANGPGCELDLPHFDELNRSAWAAAFDPNEGNGPLNYQHPKAPGRVRDHGGRSPSFH